MPTSNGNGAILLDTHALVWLATLDGRLSERARAVAEDLDNRLYLSAASVWELAIKKSLGRIAVEPSLPAFLDEQTRALGLRHLDIVRDHAMIVEGLPFHHRDPFDRLLVAQARHEAFAILSADPAFDDYAVTRIW